MNHGMAPDTPVDISPEQVREQLNRLIQAPSLVQSAQLCRFLRHVVERKLAGDIESLKENMLGIEVFDRGGQFDARKDSVVRVEARRLRSKLEEYYATVGVEDPVVIRMPKGGYIPEFEARAGAIPDAPEVKPRPGWPIRVGLAAIVSLIAGATYWILARPSGIAPTNVAIAVLPFANTTGDPEADYYADGLTEELIDSLGRNSGLRVVARSSVFQYKGGKLDPREIGRRLGADVLVEGSFRKQGPKVRISTQLIDARTGFESWSQTVERDSSLATEVQQEIAAAIAAKLKARPAADAAKHSTENAEAWELYRKGRFYWNQRTPASTRSAIASFRAALDKDPGYALAWAGLADAYSVLGFMEGVPTETRQQAAQAAARAVQLDDSLAETHVAKATAQALYEWDWAGAEKSYRRAIALDPNSSLALYGLSKLLASERRFDEAIPAVRKALELDPLSPIIATSVGWELSAARRYPEADAAFTAAMALNPNFTWMHLFRAWSYEARGNFTAAIADLKLAVDLGDSGGMATAELAYALARNGRNNEAGDLLSRIQATSRQRFVSGFVFARAYEGLGRRNDATAALEQAADEHSPMIVFIGAEPIFDPMRSDPRFQALIKRLRF